MRGDPCRIQENGCVRELEMKVEGKQWVERQKGLGSENQNWKKSLHWLFCRQGLNRGGKDSTCFEQAGERESGCEAGA